MFEALNSATELLARVQFAFVVSFHILFPSFTISLGPILAFIEFKWLRTGDVAYKDMYKFWAKIFAIFFGLGVVSGIVMSYQFGTNWSLFTDKIGNVIGPLLGYEVMTAFFLEASFLGIMLFGWGRVSDRMHFVATCTVAAGTALSAFWILAANSWMQTPQGFEIGADGLFYPTSWLEIIFNPSLPYRFFHMITASFLTTSFVMMGVYGYYMLKGKHTDYVNKLLPIALSIIAVAAPLQVLIGDMHGVDTLHHQPAKVAAMEGTWETEKGSPLRLFAIPDQESQSNKFEIGIPKLGALILTHSLDGEVKGLKEWSKEEQPPVFIVFWAFRIMVGLGLLMVLSGLIGTFLYFKKKIYSTKWYHILCIATTPVGFIAILAGWFVTEVGRQPYTVYEVLHRSDSLSPVMGSQIAFSLAVFFLLYSTLFATGLYYIISLVKKGPNKSS